MDYYKILNLNYDATLKEIEQAYLDLSSFYNPSSNVSKLAYKKFREVNKAYRVLKEEKQREIYNLINKDKILDNEKISYDGNVLSIDDFNKSIYESENLDITDYNNSIVDNEHSDYTYININLPYIYYLLNSEYSVSYYKDVIVDSKGVCPVCLGLGKVKENGKISYCKACLRTGKDIEIKKEKVMREVAIKDKIIIDEDKVILNFNFSDIDNYSINGNEINWKYKVSQEEFFNGIKWEIKKERNFLIIEKKDFSVLKDSYLFFDKVVNIEYILDSYRGKDKKGYIICDSEIVYLNLKDYTYSVFASDVYNYKVELNDKYVILNNLGEKGYNASNGNLILEVIKVENNTDLKIFFDKEVKKVSAKLFKVKGFYNNHYFKGDKKFEYDDKYIYLPNLAYKIKLKESMLFLVLFAIGYGILPLILFFTLGISMIFFIISFIWLIVYLIVINLIMEVKI